MEQEFNPYLLSSAKPENVEDKLQNQNVPEKKPDADIEAKIQAAVIAERNRCKAIDELPDNVGSDLKFAAKYGEKICNAGELAMFVLAKNDPKNIEALNNINKDNEASKANKVTGASATPDDLTDEQKKINEAKTFAKERQERKKNRK